MRKTKGKYILYNENLFEQFKLHEDSDEKKKTMNKSKIKTDELKFGVQVIF